MNPSLDELTHARERLAERYSMKEPPSVLLKIPAEIVKDTILNLNRALDGETKILERGERLLIGLAIAAVKGAIPFADWLEQACMAAGKSKEECEAAKAASFTCATYNGYYKFRGLIENPEFDAFPPTLRATPFVKSILGKKFVELLCIAVSVQNACGYCVRGHVKVAKEEGATLAMIDEVVRVGAVVGALCPLA